jgi:hypothetical protein
MKRQWKKIWIQAILWLFTEIILNVLGLDNLADYSEFIFEQKNAIAKRQPQLAVVIPLRRPKDYYSLMYRFPIALNA